MRVEKNAFETPSAKYRLNLPFGCVPFCNSTLFGTPSSSGSPFAPLPPLLEFGSRPKRVSQSFGSPSPSVSGGGGGGPVGCQPSCTTSKSLAWTWLWNALFQLPICPPQRVSDVPVMNMSEPLSATISP